MKKRLLCALFVLCMVFSVLPLTASAEEDGEATSAGYFRFSNGAIYGVNYANSFPADVVIPDRIDDEPVTMITAYAFMEWSGLTSITIPSSVTTIGDRVFSQCTALASITIPSSVEEIGTYAFYNCPLTDVYYLGTKEQWESVNKGEFVADATSNAEFIGNIPDDFPFTPPDNLIYGGTKKEATVTKTNAYYGEFTVRYYKNSAEAEPINAGTYTVKIDIKKSDTYDAVTGFELGSFTIAKATPNVTDPIAQNSITYGAP